MGTTGIETGIEAPRLATSLVGLLDELGSSAMNRDLSGVPGIGGVKHSRPSGVTNKGQLGQHSHPPVHAIGWNSLASSKLSSSVSFFLLISRRSNRESLDESIGWPRSLNAVFLG